MFPEFWNTASFDSRMMTIF